MSFLKNALSAVGLGSQIGLSTGAELGNTLLDNYYSKKNTKKAYERDLAFWNMQNEYNTPENQVKRYREAGLNPYLIYGQISPGNSSSSVHSGIAQEHFNVNPLDDILNSASKILALKNQNTQNKLLETQNIEALNRKDITIEQLKRWRHDNKIIFGNPNLPSSVQLSPMYGSLSALGTLIGKFLAGSGGNSTNDPAVEYYTNPIFDFPFGFDSHLGA